MRQRITKSSMFLAMKILAFGLLLLTMSLTHPAPILAQGSCQELNDLMNFDYRNWGIGTHRDCELYNLPCQALKAKQIIAGAPIQLWILASREAALSAGVSPMPEHIRTQLAHLYPASLLDSVRYKTGSGFLGTLQFLRDEMDESGAITLKEVIVFRNASDATCNVRLWAHELEHVRQYGNLGVDGFAQAYVDQTCVFPGDNLGVGYKSDECKLERRADRKKLYDNQRNLVLNCTSQKAPATVILSSCPLTREEEFIASDSIQVRQGVVLQSSGNVTLRAGRGISFSPEFWTEPKGKLSATIEPNLR